MRGRIVVDMVQIAAARVTRSHVASPRGGRRAYRKGSFVADQRGAVAFETVIVYIFMVSFLLMPLADVAAAGFRFISAWSALRSFGQYIQYKSPPDPANPGTWVSTLQTTVAGHTIGNIQVMCGSTACNSGNLGLTPKYFTFSTTVTLAPIVLTSVLCPSSCTYTLPYSERFQ
ncbi:hypothetical protein ABIA06_002853 [Bradyrhizobium yuanmingense]|uniref:Flp pilus assembly protein TadG n=2 Tax=Nitrobacteraceae TaxID=41294 RepID=A0A1C3X9Q2_9BRAD|nr:hypothetical protein [Bradyrhizobium yuanmingense]TWI21974.1 hypothetical protein IQ15_05839 [Bradyrhizobium yuanmingense]SCB48915.1 hypothetical protein GA0061099_1010241 [Bradyrhizobium yuanmingense]